MQTPNQIDRLRDDVQVTASDLLQMPQGTVTEAGLRLNIRVGVQYLEAWLRGNGCVPLYNLMEDAATAEISRTQVWQWLHNAQPLDDGRPVTLALFRRFFDEELERIAEEVGPQRYQQGKFRLAAKLFQEDHRAGGARRVPDAPRLSVFGLKLTLFAGPILFLFPFEDPLNERSSSPPDARSRITRTPPQANR